MLSDNRENVMAVGDAIVSSDMEQDLGEKSTINQTNYTDNAAKYLTVSEKGKFKWNGPFEVLTLLMNELTKSDTKWSTPGGYCKLLEVNDIAVRWYSDSNSFTLNGNSSDDIKSQLRNIASLAHPEAVATRKDYKETEDASTDMGHTDASEACSCTCSCVRVVKTDLEGLKLDMTILESRLFAALSENKCRSESDINSLRLNLIEMEGVVRHQDEIICRLNEENIFFKSKLMSLEKLILNECQDHQNNDIRSVNAISITEESPSRDCEQVINLNKNTLSPSHTTTVCIKIIRIQIWRVITQNIFDKFVWFLHHC
jgi:hypothetical protein